MNSEVSKALKITDIMQGIDILEESLRNLDSKLLKIMLLDRTTGKNIIWATNDYTSYGLGFDFHSEITPEKITGPYSKLVQPRTTKAQNEQTDRTHDKAEVFTPSWLCNKQNNLIDSKWFGKNDVFNIQKNTSWTSTTKAICFINALNNWKKYVDALRLEISCGEAPYLVSRYDTVTGKRIPLNQRIGLLDRKMRIVNENTKTVEEWLVWSQRAFESTYGYEFQGDNLLLARENLLYSYIEYYMARFHQTPSIMELRKIARVISWNIWQMDGLKYVVPGSCKPETKQQMSIFDYNYLAKTEETLQFNKELNICPGCSNGNIFRHTGNYCKVMDWRYKCSRTFVSILGGKAYYGKL